MKTSLISALALTAALAGAPALAQGQDNVVTPAIPVVINGITISEADYPYVKARCEELYRASLDDTSGTETSSDTDASDDQTGGDDQNEDDQNGDDPAGGDDQTPDQTTATQSDTEDPQGVDEAVTTFDLSTLTLEICEAAGLVDKT